MAVYDLQSNSRVGRVDLKSVPVELAFAPDGSVLIVVVQVRRRTQRAGGKSCFHHLQGEEAGLPLQVP